jgi:hypothetical protein
LRGREPNVIGEADLDQRLDFERKDIKQLLLHLRLRRMIFFIDPLFKTQLTFYHQDSSISQMFLMEIERFRLN